MEPVLIALIVILTLGADVDLIALSQMIVVSLPIEAAPGETATQTIALPVPQ
jgi:hypothetical protein